jgi:STE24 endopeptidase
MSTEPPAVSDAVSAAQPLPPDVQEYHRVKRILHISELILAILYWAFWVGLGPGHVRWISQHVHSPWLGLFTGALVMLGGMVLVSLPLGYYGEFLIEKRFGLSNQTPQSWFVFEVKTWLVGAALAAVVLGGLYALLWYGGAMWGVWAWVGVMLLTVVLAKVFPLLILPMFYSSKPLDRPSLTDRLHALAAGTGLTITGVYDLALSKDTKKANAMLTGLGSSRRVYLSDTLLEAFSEDRIGVVFAHELGHHIRGHIWKAIGMGAAAMSVMVALIYWRLGPFQGRPADWVDAVGALPQVFLIATLWPLLIAPITNAVSRRFERQCDSDALRITSDPAAYRGAFELLARMNLADPNPPRWEEILFYDHPPISKRIAMADQVEKGSQAQQLS